MTFNEARACRKSRKRSLETCIDGNACKENTTDKRWVGILTQPHGFRVDFREFRGCCGSIVRAMPLISVSYV